MRDRINDLTVHHCYTKYLDPSASICQEMAEGGGEILPEINAETRRVFARSAFFYATFYPHL